MTHTSLDGLTLQVRDVERSRDRPWGERTFDVVDPTALESQEA
jgi:hypothetical protein